MFLFLWGLTLVISVFRTSTSAAFLFTALTGSSCFQVPLCKDRKSDAALATWKNNFLVWFFYNSWLITVSYITGGLDTNRIEVRFQSSIFQILYLRIISISAHLLLTGFKLLLSHLLSIMHQLYFSLQSTKLWMLVTYS